LLALALLAPGVAAQKPARKRASTPPTRSQTSTPPQVPETEQEKLADAASQSRAHLLKASNVYRESLEKLLELQRQDETRAADVVEKRKSLLDLGVIAKRELDESEQALTEARSKTAETQKQIAEIDQLVAEVNAAEELAKMPPAPPGVFRSSGVMIRYVGASRWALGDIGKVDAFFRLKFSKPLPVSALGQTETHNHLGFDHREAIDVAVHPDSAEGQELINYLASQGISFIAIRGAIAGSATGAHIHIGPPSKRIVAR
jgi:vacuolar-type H+-ATPase subunit I/STV1